MHDLRRSNLSSLMTLFLTIRFFFSLLSFFLFDAAKDGESCRDIFFSSSFLFASVVAEKYHRRQHDTKASLEEKSILFSFFPLVDLLVRVFFFFFRDDRTTRKRKQQLKFLQISFRLDFYLFIYLFFDREEKKSRI